MNEDTLAKFSEEIALPSPLKLHIELTDEQFFQLCQHNRDLQFERTAKGEILIMPPTGEKPAIAILI